MFTKEVKSNCPNSTLSNNSLSIVSYKQLTKAGGGISVEEKAEENGRRMKCE